MPTDREDRSKLRGFGFVKFETEEYLKDALTKSIEVCGQALRTKNGNDNQRGGGNTRGGFHQGRSNRNESGDSFQFQPNETNFGGDGRAAAGGETGIGQRIEHNGVLIDEINKDELFEAQRVAGHDFDRYKKTEVNFFCFNLYSKNIQYKISCVVDGQVDETKDSSKAISSFDCLRPELKTMLQKLKFSEPTQVQKW